MRCAGTCPFPAASSHHLSAAAGFFGTPPCAWKKATPAETHASVEPITHAIWTEGCVLDTDMGVLDTCQSVSNTGRGVDGRVEQC